MNMINDSVCFVENWIVKKRKRGKEKMKRVSIIVIHENYKTIKTMTVRYNNSGQLVDLIRDNEIPYIYEHFNDLYKSILNILKNNNMYAKYWSGFNRKWYDIQWINAENPTKIESFGYKEN